MLVLKGVAVFHVFLRCRYLREYHWLPWASFDTESAALDEAYRLRGSGATCQVVPDEKFHEFGTSHCVSGRTAT